MNDFFKVLADETRLRCIALIFEQQQICVCELIHALDLPQSKISRHLSIIKLNGVITQRREGQWVLYSINSKLSSIKRNMIEMYVTELKNTSPFKDDKNSLLAMTNRPLINKEKVDV
ncbi:MAG TPA: metalloregulator ArsR/SmtB family transcription factor [Leucothrix sp.]|nr:metalloregulator ArsR/SmtB family transcription factor [Leucothrix sp.]